MAQISDVMHASAVFDAARQELAWAYSGNFTGVPEPMKGAVLAISEVLNEAEMRWVASTCREEPMAMAAVVDNPMATGDGEEKKREDVGVVKEKEVAIGEGEAESKVKNWLLRLEEVACDMRAVARKELIGDYSKTDDRVSARWLPCLPTTSRADRISAPTVDTVALKLEELKKQYDEEFGYSTGLPLVATCMEQPACSSAAGGQEERETSVTGDVLVERDDDAKQRIIGIIDDGIERFSWNSAIILPIIGPPGVGKTTLVKSVFREGSFGAGYKVWVDMRKGWGIKEIHESIIEVLGRHHFAGLDLDAWICPTIRKVESEADYDRYIIDMLSFNKTRLLLVFNNLVEEQDLATLDELLKFLSYAGELVITIMMTRSEDFTSRISGSSKVSPYRLHPCSDNMCWEIIKRTSCIDLEATGTAAAVSEMVGCEIASKCSGIPLAAKALGRFLQSVDPQEWPGLVRDVWNIGGGFSCDSQQLRRLPTHSATVFTHLRSSGVSDESCLSLAYCAFVFPKGKNHGVVTRDLLNQWCCLGITTRKHGTSCILELLDRSFLLGEKYASDDETNAASLLLKMEDLMHDFARYLLGDRLIVVDGKIGGTSSTSSPVNNKGSSAYLALVSNFDANQLDISSKLPARTLALRFEGCGEMTLSDGGFASFGKYLRLLDLSGYSEKKKLPDFIRHLKQLRYLKAPGMQDQELPRSVTALHELRYLILQGIALSGCSGLKSLPDSFGRLWRLEHLDLSACSGIEALPESFCWLRSLSHLDMSSCSGLKALPESFGMLTSLWHLDLSGCSGLQDLPTSFQRLTELRHLDLSGLSSLQALPMVSLPTELRYLNLSGCSGLQGKQLPDAREPFKLRHLDLSRCSSVSYLPDSYAANKNLVHLNLSGCSSLTELPTYGDWWWAKGLKHLDLSYCSQLRDVRISVDAGVLRYLDLSGCFSVRHDWNMVERVRRSGGGGRASGPKDPSLREQGTSGTTN